MGLDNRQAGNYINIYAGKFCQRVPEGTAGATARKLEKGTNAGKIVHEKYYDSFTGKLVGIKTTDGAYGRSWVFSFKDGGEVYHLQLSYSNSFATAFLKMLPNVDLTKEMKVQPSVKEVDGKNKSSLFINQSGQSVKHAYTKDAPNGLPPMVEITVKGVKVWDDTDRIEFLYQMVMDKIVPKLEGFTGATESHDDDMAVSSDTVEGQGINPDDIPF